MFVSERRPVIFPQVEHARFAAALALAWAERPPLPFESFVRGVADHDRGYGEHDEHPIGGVMTSEEWVGIQRRGFAPRGEDPVVDLVVALHVRRLLASRDDELERAAYAEVDELLPGLLATAGVSRTAVEAADAITNVCDVLSFEFCFEEPSEREVRGHRIALDGFGRVEVSPWPFVTPRLLGLVTAFAADGYPARLVPVVVPYDVVPA
ncbi:MAG TPA: DUF3891 family protein [Gaiella sp.]|nr:DUF3891 family protein [Gaiella sp.]